MEFRREIYRTSYILSVLTGDLGIDIVRDQPVADIVLRQLPYTVALLLSDIGWATLVGIPLGCFSAIRRNSLADKLIAVLSFIFIAIPFSEIGRAPCRERVCQFV